MGRRNTPVGDARSAEQSLWLYMRITQNRFGLACQIEIVLVGSCILQRSVSTYEYDSFRLLLIEARLGHRMTQVGLAKRLGRPQSFVSKYERGERRLDVIEFIEVAEAIGIDPAGLINKLRAAPTGQECGTIEGSSK